MSDAVQVENQSITKPASKVMLGGVASLVGALATNVIVAAVFGAGAHMDAYLTALVIPGYLQIVFYSSLYFVLLPAFIDSETKRGDDDAWKLVGTFFWITTCLLLMIAVVGSIFSTQIIQIVAPGFAPDKSELAARMLRILFFSIPLMGLSTLTTGIQNSRNHFFWPSVAPAFGSFVNAVILVCFSGWIGPMALCWGGFAATALQASFTIAPVLAHGWKRLLPLNDPQVRMIGKLMVPLVLSGLIVSFSPIADRYFASSLPDGQIAYMGYANKISNIFVVLLASGIAAAIFPSMARTYVEDGLPGLSQKQDFGMRLTFAIALPALFVGGAVSIPLISTLFERGAFLPIDTLGVSRIVVAYLLSDLLFRMMGNIFQRSLYVTKDTHTQPIVSTAFVILYLLTAHFFVTHWGYVGLVWAGVMRNGLSTLTLSVILAIRFPRHSWAPLITSLVKYLASASAAFLCGRLCVALLAAAPAVFQLVVGGVLGLATYFLCIRFMEREMVAYVFQLSGIQYAYEVLHSGMVRLFPLSTSGRSR